MKKDIKLIKWAKKLTQSQRNLALGWEGTNDFTTGYTTSLVTAKLLNRKQANILNRCFGWTSDDFEFDFKTGNYHKNVNIE